MKTTTIIIFVSLLLLLIRDLSLGQNQKKEIDSLVYLLIDAGRQWSKYSEPLIEIGEPAVPVLIEAVKDKNLDQWSRRVCMVTLNQIHSPRYVPAALEILFDRNEIPDLRNRATAGLSGFDLAHVKDELWKVYNEFSNEFHKSNMAHLMMQADTALAYKAFCNQYFKNDGHIKMAALLSLVKIRPHESATWYMDAIADNNWMTANMAMDSLVRSEHFKAEKVLALFNNDTICDEVRWRVVYIFGYREEPESLPLLLKAFKDDSWLVHTEAAVALSRRDAKEIIPEMETLKNHDKYFVRDNSRWVTSQLTDE